MPECLKCHSHFPNWKFIDGKVRNLNKRKYCLACSPFGVRNRKQLHYDPAYRAELDASHKSQQSRRISHRKILLEARGNECQICGYGRSKRALAFHHIDEKTKKFTLAAAICQYKWAEVVWEASKCLLVCANCHAEIHDGLHTELLVELGIALAANQTKFVETVLGTTTREKGRPCSYCDCEFVSTGDQKFCSTECSFKAHRKVERPTKQDLQEMLWTIPTSQIAVRFGVSDKAVSKWAMQYELSKPGRGYWQQKASC